MTLKIYDQFKVNEVSNPRIENLLATQPFDSITESLSSDGNGVLSRDLYSDMSLRSIARSF